MNINNKSFSIDSNPNNSSNPYKAKVNQYESTGLNMQKQNDYQVSPSLLTYTFRNANEQNNNSVIDQNKLNHQKQNSFVQSKLQKNKLSEIIQNQNSQIEKTNRISKGLLKQSMKVQYEFDGIKSQIINHQKRQSYERPVKSEIVKSKAGIVSANIFSCMDAPDYQRDFQVSPKVISRR